MLTSGVPEEGQEEASELQPAAKHARHSEPGRLLVMGHARRLWVLVLTATRDNPIHLPIVVNHALDCLCVC
jgi:hypothetical protein